MKNEWNSGYTKNTNNGFRSYLLKHRNLKIAEKLNKVETSINFTYDKESNKTVPFLDILIIKSHNILTFKIYRKPTNKNDCIYFLLSPSQKKNQNRPHNWLLFRICSQQYLDEKFNYIEHSLKSLKYPRFYILNARKKPSIYTCQIN